LSHELIARGWSVHLATDSRAQRFAGSFPAEEIHAIQSATFGSRNPLAMARSALSIWNGVREAGSVINRIKADTVVGFGGYPTLPPVFAATRRRVPTLVHEQNAVMGRANKALAARVTAIAGGFLAEEGPFAGKTVTTGNPVRPAVLEAANTPYQPAIAGKPFDLLVFGGSQGAQYFSEILPQAVALLPQASRVRLRIVQQARPEDEQALKAAYAGEGIEAEVSTFFTDMAQRMANASFVISRSGASTVSEIAVIGRPALLVPYPHALDHDQAANAAALEKVGGAEIVTQERLTPDRLRGMIEIAMNMPDKLAAMADASRSVGRPDAAALLADLVEAISSGESPEQFKRRLNP
jgi:UDP-N-acetylglucosamine--N-acetylmuramyl-(pentapeptide) pyrophosphoryl-undecaprenol N-acetylglucosamine transferase